MDINKKIESAIRFNDFNKAIELCIQIAKEHAAEQFTRGYAAACANLVSMDGGITNTASRELFECNFHTIKELEDMGVEQRDIDLLRSTIKEIERRRE